jgi:Tol biopolymer transport system component
MLKVKLGLALLCVGLAWGAMATAQNKNLGSIVYADNRVIRVMNLGTGRTKSFSSIDFREGGVSVSETGVIAQLQDRDREDTVLIYLTKLDGTFIREFTYPAKLSFPLGGARISRDGKAVAFALGALLDSGERGDRVVTCETQGEHRCVYFDNLRDPAWLPDNRFVGINYGRQLYISNGPINFANPAQNRVDVIGPNTLDRASVAATSPNGKYVVFSSNAGVPRVYALNLQSGRVTTLTSDGIGQYTPLISNDGQFLYYIQQCCQRSPTLGGGVATSGHLHRIAFRPDITTPTPYLKNVVRDAEANPLDPDNQYGVTSQVLR